MDFTRILPVECLNLIISSTSPADACRSATVCPALRSVADSDTVWEKFLPCDHRSIISGSSSSLRLSPGRKDVYFHLSSHPILIHNSTMSFQLEKGTGKKCYTLGARALSIAYEESPYKWTWTSLPESRFPEVAVLLIEWWLEVKGRIETRILSPNTNYAAYLVYKLKAVDGIAFKQRPICLSVNVDGVASREVRRGSLYPWDESGHVRERGDGWIEAEMGEFLNGSGDDGTVEFVLKQNDSGYPVKGLIVEGIELRPKVVRQWY
ncbi:phloem protein 2-B11 [Hibiscus trionum]|uniref:Phloem protein 2-B11 n=1 Tax=Hibiscus trionum TaxID=183268 RepID=A0A9W7IJR7_HIBTR|nr:phloem protein 2-B11 [Hibiscus trionum]